MIRKILCATDLSDASGPAVTQALDLGRELDALVFILHVDEHPARALPRLEAHVKAMNVHHEGVRLETLTRSGSPAEAILSAAVDLGVDLIVVGTSGHKLGSVAAKIVRSSARPVLTVRAR